jgi:hypothetical protein
MSNEGRDGCPIPHNLSGEVPLDCGGYEIRPPGSTKSVKEAKAYSRYNQWSKALADLTASWEKISITEKVHSGDLFLYRNEEGRIPNIHGGLYPSIPLFHIMAYPDRIDSVVKKMGQITSVTAFEMHWKYFRNPISVLTEFMSKGNGDDAIRRLKQAGYLIEEQVIISAADFRLFDKIDNFLINKFNLSLPRLPQEREPFYP